MTPHDDPMRRLPELPSDVDETRAGLWAASVLMTTAIERQWDLDRLRMLMLTLCAGLLRSAPDAQLHTELQAAIDQARAHSADKQ